VSTGDFQEAARQGRAEPLALGDMEDDAACMLVIVGATPEGRLFDSWAEVIT